MSELAACTVQPVIWPVPGMSEYAVGERDRPAAVSLCVPRPYQWRGAGGREWRPVTALWAARRWPVSLGTPWLSVPLSPLRKVPLYVLRDIFPKCVHVQHGCMCAEREASRIKAPVTFLIPSSQESSRYRDQYGLRRGKWEVLLVRAANTFHYDTRTWILVTKSL